MPKDTQKKTVISINIYPMQNKTENINKKKCRLYVKAAFFIKKIIANTIKLCYNAFVSMRII